MYIGSGGSIYLFSQQSYSTVHSNSSFYSPLSLINAKLLLCDLERKLFSTMESRVVYTILTPRFIWTATLCHSLDWKRVRDLKLSSGCNQTTALVQSGLLSNFISLFFVVVVTESFDQIYYCYPLCHKLTLWQIIWITAAWQP